jgi:hypothetical protein
LVVELGKDTLVKVLVSILGMEDVVVVEQILLPYMELVLREVTETLEMLVTRLVCLVRVQVVELESPQERTAEQLVLTFTA